ncbi:Bug family tripartite tricarboxylate transporter substrate binding protein [Variovorax davisae]|uniref:Bug family tripartite tricarboxylate transporter substrate binding protein n=1 Tax=Variovorax davisae TaxID=3053515 RepID=UPI00257824AF|nr:tripartite tricarboxylate transporter substrate-binding protein [Variovorax sp. J22P271]
MATASAQPDPFPTRPVRVVVPFPAGGTLDGPARLLATSLSRVSGQQFIVDNKAGAGGTVGAGEVARAPADGYTLLISSSAVPISQVLYKSVPFDSVKSYREVAMFSDMPSVIAVNPQRVPVKTLAELIAYAKAHPAKLNYGSPGSGTGAHLAAEMFKDHVGVDILHVPYRGAAPAVTDALGGQIDMVIAGQSSVAQQIAAGKLRALAVTTTKRSAQLPDVPTVDEVVKGYESTTWIGLAAPAATPDAVMARLTTFVREAMDDPSLRKKLIEAGVTPILKEEKEAAEQIAREVVNYGALVRKANIHAE